MKRLSIAAALLFTVFTSPSLPAHSDAFIEDLLASGDQFRALTVMKEREFRFRGSEQGLAYGKRVLGLYLRSGEYEAADSWLSRILEHYPGLDKRFDGVRMKAELAFLYGNYNQAASGSQGREPLYTFAEAAKDPSTARVDPARCVTSSCQELSRKLGEFQATPSKNASLALALGVVPGLGQIYAGSTWGGITSLVVNGLLIGTTIYAAGHGERALAVLTGTIGAGLYFGSIYAGYETARRYNEARLDRGVSRVRSIPIEMNLLKLAF